MKTREEWLVKVSEIMNDKLFKSQMPKYRVTCGFPTSKAFSKNNRTIGECWSSTVSDDETHEIIVSMTIDDPVEVTATLAHEMIHALVGLDVGHRGEFRTTALDIGLTGKMTATKPGPKFIEFIEPVLKELGPYPHKKINKRDNPKKQTTRLIKCECLTCGYNVRVTRKWIDEQGMPVCANLIHGPMSSEYGSDAKDKPSLGKWSEITPEQPMGEVAVFVCRKGESDSCEWIKKWVYSSYSNDFTHWMPAPVAKGVKP